MRSTSPELQDGRHGSAWCPPPRATTQPRCATSTTPRARSGRGLGSRGQRRRTAGDVALARCRCRGARCVAGRCSPDRRIGGMDLLARGRHHRLVRAGPSTCHQRTHPRPLLERYALRLRTAATALFQRLIADGTLPAGYATDDGAGALYRGTEFVEAFSEYAGAAEYYVDSDSARAVERRLDPRRL